MLPQTPLSLFCCILLCIPFAIIFTFTTPSPTIAGGGATTDHPLPAATSTKIFERYPGSILMPPRKNLLKSQNCKNQTTNSSISTPPPPSRSQLAEEDDDDPLLKLASRVNPNPKPIKKLAFMFLTTSPLPFAALWELFFSRAANNSYNIYIHADPNLNYTTSFNGVFAGRVIPSKPTRRYSPTLISAARRLLAHALLHDESNSMFALLSPSCIPIHSFNYTYQALIKSRKSFIEILKNERGAYDRWATRGEHAMLPEVDFKDFRIGSQFWVVKRKHARIIVNDTRLWSKFKLPCLRYDTCYPEEHYFPTLLSMMDLCGCVPYTLTHVDWKGGHGGHPRMYKNSEVGPELIGNLRKWRLKYGDEKMNGSDASVRRRTGGPFLFARKFSSGSLHPLMSMANDVIFKD